MLNFKLKILIIIIILFFGLSIGSTVNAAQLSLSSQSNNFSLNQEFVVELFLNTQDKEINALEGEILFPSDLLELKEVGDGNSIVSFWINQPKKILDNKIIFSGVIPGGYYEQKGLVLSLIFKAKQQGSGLVRVSKTQVLENDGQGTPVKVLNLNFPFTVSKQALEPVQEAQEELLELKSDDELPEIFYPQVASDPTVFNGKWFLIFATQDKGTGIDYYEVKQGRGPFIRAQSPYLLQNQALNAEIRVKAVDKNGNQRVVTLAAKHPPYYQKLWFWCIIILGVIILIKIFLCWRK